MCSTSGYGLPSAARRSSTRARIGSAYASAWSGSVIPVARPARATADRMRAASNGAVPPVRFTTPVTTPVTTPSATPSARVLL